MVSLRYLSIAVALLGLLQARPATAVDLVVEALLPGLAVVKIDRQRVTLREGQSSNGVQLVEADARSALFEINGKRQRLSVSQRISGIFTEPEERRVDIPRNAQLQYVTTAEINGRRLQVIVDTGANIIALNSAQARMIGLAADEGVSEKVQTAGSVVPARRVLLDSVDVGGIRVEAVVATVLEGDAPPVALLGMSFLQHVELQERDGVLTLRARW